MSRLQELIERYCPDGVEYRSLESIVDMHAGKHISGTQISSIEDSDHPFPCYGGNGLRGYVADYNVEGERVLIGRQGALCGNVKFASGKFYATEHAVICSPLCEFDCRWLLYALDAMNLNQYKTKSAQPGLAVSNIKPLLIPFPPVVVQREIVRLLDAYTAAHDALVDRLNEEIELQAKSLAVYRESLLTFSERERVRWATLGDVCNVGRGTYITGKEVISGDVPVILGGKEPAYYHNVPNHEGEAIVVSRSGVNAGYASYWNQPIFVSDGFLIDASETDIELQYVFRYLEMKQPELIAMNRGSGVPHITGKMLKDVRIPVPSITEQVDIANALDNATCVHERLVNELRKEANLHESQLAEFRNQLLTFPEKVA